MNFLKLNRSRHMPPDLYANPSDSRPKSLTNTKEKTKTKDTHRSRNLEEVYIYVIERARAVSQEVPSLFVRNKSTKKTQPPKTTP